MNRVAKATTLTLAGCAAFVGSAGVAAAGGGGASAHGASYGSGGGLSGNVVQAPVDLDANACGNTVSVVGAVNPAFGNHCVNK